MYNIIRDDLKIAMKNNDTIAKITIKNVLNKIQMGAKDAKVEINNEIVTKAAQKEISQLKDTLSYLKEGSEKYIECQKQIELVSKYLPKMASKKEIEEYLNEINPDNIGTAMKLLKEKFQSTLDGKMASVIVKEYISKKAS